MNDLITEVLSNDVANLTAIDPVARGLAASVSLSSLGLFAGTSAAALAGAGALRSAMPFDAPAAGFTQAAILNTANPASTPTFITPVASGTISNKFRFIGGKYIIPGNTAPLYGYVVRQQIPSATLGFGDHETEFESDAPYVTILHARSQSASTVVYVNDVEFTRIVGGATQGTAQAGASSSITLASSANTFDGSYFNSWVHITGGTGAGQYRQCTNYVGSTRVATVGTPWTTVPDTTSVYEVTDTLAPFSNLTNTSASTYYLTLPFGERKMRKIRIAQSGQAFMGIYVSSPIDTVQRAPRNALPVIMWGGDSFGTVGSDIGFSGTMPKVAANLLGMEARNLCAPGSGIVNPAGTPLQSYNLVDRWLPPPNAWAINYDGVGGGSFTVTQNGVTATIPYAGTLASIQATVDAAFGAGNFRFIQGGAGNQRRAWFVGQGSFGAVTAPMTANFSGLPGGAGIITQWKGDLEDHLPRDAAGNVLPFLAVIAMGHNDTISSGYTPAQVQAAHSALYAGLMAKYGTKITIIVIGNMFLPGGSVQSDATNCSAAIKAAVTATLPLINGALPFIDPLALGYSTGTGGQGGTGNASPKGDGNSDIWTGPDYVHPRSMGQIGYGVLHAANIQQILTSGGTA